jgi:hypothetical protein
VLCPKMDDAGVLKTVGHMARHHAQFWNAKELGSGELGLKAHNSPWYQPGWGDDLLGYWARFEAKVMLTIELCAPAATVARKPREPASHG